MSLAQAVSFKPANFYPYFNTRTTIDTCVGQFLRGYKNEWLLDGGAGPINGVSARSGYYKSTTVDNLILNMLEIYPGSEYFKMDTENTSTSLERFRKLNCGRVENLEERVHLTNKGELNLKQYTDMVKAIGEEKLKHAKDYTVETPFLDVNTGKPIKMLLPTFQSLDSISNLTTDTNEEAFDIGLEDKKSNTADMHDGRIKKRLLDRMTVWAYKYGMCFFITAHIGEKQDMDPRNPTPKQNQWMRHTEKITNAGKNFLYLPNLSFQLSRPSPLVDDNKLPLYPSGTSSSDLERVEINRLDLKVLRGKNNITGTVVPSVMSQHYGILADLSYYEYLREVEGKVKSGETGNSGFQLKGHNRHSPLMPDVCITRKNIRSICAEDYKVRRMLEIMFQFHWISRYWNLNNYPFKVPETLEKFVNGINGSGSIVLDDVLNSRGYWTYDKTEKRQYLSIMDIFFLIGEKEQMATVQVPEAIIPTVK